MSNNLSVENAEESIKDKEETKEGSCPTCGRAFNKEISLPLHLIVGSIIGFLVGTVFVLLWFQGAGLLTPMAIIHEVSGFSLGLLGGYIVALIRRKL